MKARIEKIYPEIGRRMKQLRVDSAMTQAETAKRMGINRNHLAYMENGGQRIHLHTLVAFGKVLGVSVHHMLEGIAP
jgi:transcriptional regulator with XRE-family HTH domain